MLESFNTEKFDYKRLSLEEQKSRGILGRLVGIIADTKNATRNGRLYSSDLWENVFNDPIMKEKIDNHIVLGELGHPIDREEVDMEKVAISLAEQPKKGKDGKIYGVFDILDTTNGRILKTLCDYGCNIGVSSRGTGDLYTDYDGNEAVDPDTYQCECWDAVLVPAVKEARLKYVTESLDNKRYGKTLKQKLTEEFDKSSDEEKKIMTEALDNLDIKLDEKLVEPTEYDLEPIKAKFAELGLDIEREGKTLFGNKHYQLRKELDHKVTHDDLVHIFDELCDLSDDNMPTTCNVGVHRDGDNIISAAVDVLKKQVPDDVDEQLEDEDGWGDEIPDQLEDTFAELEALMYEIRNCVRDSYAGFGDKAEDLAAELNRLADQLGYSADSIELNADSLNENIPVEDDKQRQYIGMLSRLKSMIDHILNYDQKYDFNSESSKVTKDLLNDISNNITKLCGDVAKFNDTVDEGCSDNEAVNEDAGNSGDDLVDQLQEALLKNGELEKDNLSLQEKLSVCNAKETKLNEELEKYKKASISLSETSKNIKALEEELDELNEKLDYKDKLIESKNERLKSLINFKRDNVSKLTESESKVSGLEDQIKKLTDQIKDKDAKLSESKIMISKYQRALKESKERYISVKSDYCGISKDDLKAKLKESYSYKDIDSACDELSEEKMNMSKLPFRINEGTQFNFKSSKNEYIKGNRLEDDEVSDYLLNILNN